MKATRAKVMKAMKGETAKVMQAKVMNEQAMKAPLCKECMIKYDFEMSCICDCHNYRSG